MRVSTSKEHTLSALQMLSTLRRMAGSSERGDHQLGAPSLPPQNFPSPQGSPKLWGSPEYPGSLEMSWAQLDRRQSQSGLGGDPGGSQGSHTEPAPVPSQSPLSAEGGRGTQRGEDFQQTLRPGGFVCVIEEVAVFPLSALWGRLRDGLGPT